MTILYTLRERCAQAQPHPEPSDRLIEPGEIAAVLETIVHLMISEGMKELAGYNAAWFMDAAGMVRS